MKDNIVIWKKESCLVGQCKNLRNEHWWSIPATTPAGLMVECYHCGRTKIIRVERNPSPTETNT
ncbi:MAG: hypothetical protein GWP19_00920 [Planctomycetia bacterium]|nr:hypothetical protein [Planctomycetia bacterium]